MTNKCPDTKINQRFNPLSSNDDKLNFQFNPYHIKNSDPNRVKRDSRPIDRIISKYYSQNELMLKKISLQLESRILMFVFDEIPTRC